MSKFEAVIMLSPDLSSANLEKQEDSFKKHLSELSGNIIAEEDWGLRHLSYKIRKFKKAMHSKDTPKHGGFRPGTSQDRGGSGWQRCADAGMAASPEHR